ncbi:MAG: hypothetical protein IKI43_04550, partial [Campylobacter sp.]|nr:hypothetical protein [Campylobacter sp.]
MAFLQDYEKHVAEREKLGIPPLPLNAQQTKEICELLKNGDSKSEFYADLLENRVSPGVDDAAKVKAEFLNEILNH